MNNVTKLKLAWKYRRFLWKYRKILRHRNEIAAMMIAGAAIAVGVILTRPRIEQTSAQSG